MASSNGADPQEEYRKQALTNDSNKPDVILNDNGGHAAPSVAGSPPAINAAKDSVKTSSVAMTPGFTTGEDFIAFPSSDEESDEDAPQIPPMSRGKDREEPEAISPELHSGKKRSADQMDGDGGGYTNKKQKMDASSRLTPWVHDVSWDSCRNLSEMMHEEVKAFVAYISPTFEEHEIRGLVVEAITRAIHSAWPDATVSAFGSYQTKLYLPLGDIDIVIQSRAMESFTKKKILFNIGQLLRRAHITTKVQVIDKAKVPIIKFVTSQGGFAVDISLNQTNGLQAGRLINRLLQELPALKSLIMTIKLFLSQRSMNEVFTGGLGSYTLVCMAVSFLQMHPKIRAAEIDPSQNLGVLVMEFFELYGHHFNYGRTGISIRDGGTYFSKMARGWDVPRAPFLLSIEDPIDTANDVSKGSYNIERVRRTLAGAHEVLTAAAFMRARVLTAKARGEYTSLRGSGGGAREYDNQSILSSVIGVTQETLNHRRMVKQLYDGGALHILLGVSQLRQSQLPSAHSLSSRAHSARAVESAWGEADMDTGDSESYRRSPETEESRYSNRRPRKRQRVNPLELNGSAPNQAIYVEDSDEDEEAVSHASKGKSLPSPQAGIGPRSHDPGKIEARRAYWASKGSSGGRLEDGELV
ncbi:hypothetical protein BU17DRAFT_92345 [Hysterangium stoloniferum]|nr:hypothetical protein BU17DRAFT_92345 [Hysterangium stoloniferum]